MYSKTGQFKLYADFIETELINEVSKFLHSKFINKTIFGHSNGGLGVLSFYVLKPQVFDNYIAASPAILWDNFYIQKNIQKKRRINKLYIFIAGKQDYPKISFSILIKKLQATNKYFKFTTYNTETHSTSGLKTLLDGLFYISK